MPFCPPLPTPVPLPLLITGIAGVAGYNAFAYFQRRYPGEVIGIRPPQTWQLAGSTIVPLDLEDRAGLQALFAAHRFGTVLNCAGNCALKSCELDVAMARRLNVASAANVAGVSRRHHCRLVHLSSDLVFSGAGAGGYVETDAADPVTVYGRMMAEGEVTIRAADPSAAVLRISLPMGPSFNGRAGAIDWIESRFRNGRPATLYFDEVRSSTYTDDLNRVFEYFLATELDGLFHVGGPRAMTLYQIGQIVNRVGGYHPPLLKGCPRHEAGPMPPRAGNVSMNSDKLLTILGGHPFAPWPVGDDLVPMNRDWHWPRSEEQPGSRDQVIARLYGYPGSKMEQLAASTHPLAG
jgi:dTDP-4-dehydrorhamnose reductase